MCKRKTREKNRLHNSLCIQCPLLRPNSLPRYLLILPRVAPMTKFPPTRLPTCPYPHIVLPSAWTLGVIHVETKASNKPRMLNLRIGLFSNTQRRSCLYLQRPDSTLYPTRISAREDYRYEEIRGACLSSLQIVQKKKMTSASSQLLHELLPATDNWKPDKMRAKQLFRDLGHQQQKDTTVT